MSSYAPSSESGTDDVDVDDCVLSGADAMDDWPLSGALAEAAFRLGPGRTLRKVNETGAALNDDEGDGGR